LFFIKIFKMNKSIFVCRVLTETRAKKTKAKVAMKLNWNILIGLNNENEKDSKVKCNGLQLKES
jgi:hypothetical protein